MAIYLPLENIGKGIAATPAIGAMVAAIYQILRDHAAHQREMERQQKGHDFSLGVMSHMAQVAFDKHVEFCEKYMTEVHETVSTLWKEGPTEKAMVHSSNLSKLRIEYATWVTEEITNSLKEFEYTLYCIGSKTKLCKVARSEETLNKAYKEADESWDTVLGCVIDKEKTPDENRAVEPIKNRIRNILGVQELTILRGALIKKAIESINT